MDFDSRGSGGQSGGEKKESIFASLSPSTPPAHAMQGVPKQADSSESVSALKQKMESMERNIVSILEQKLAEQLKPMSPPPPPPNRPAPPEMGLLLKKIEELEKKLADSSQFSAVQMKNIEESKISARREIEDLLKAVREQQKYSEMDRQMHEQLEKSWGRVGELEKKLMDFYSSILAVQAQGAQASGEHASGVAALTARVDGLAGQSASNFRMLEEKLLALGASMSHLAAMDIREMVKAQMHELRKDLIFSAEENGKTFAHSLDAFNEKTRERVSEDMEKIRKNFEAGMEDLRRNFSVQAEVFYGKLEEFSRLAGANKEKAGGAEAASGNQPGTSAPAINIPAGKIDSRGKALACEFTDGVERGERGRVESSNAKYSDALTSRSAAAKVYNSTDFLQKKLSFLEKELSAFVKQVDKERFSSALGVSGMVLRRNLDTMEDTAAEIRSQLETFESVKKQLEAGFKSGFDDKIKPV